MILSVELLDVSKLSFVWFREQNECRHKDNANNKNYAKSDEHELDVPAHHEDNERGDDG
jgi:hypothetical protein